MLDVTAVPGSVDLVGSAVKVVAVQQELPVSVAELVHYSASEVVEL